MLSPWEGSITQDFKDTATLAGVAAGYLSLVRLLWGDIRDFYKKPWLVIEFNFPEDLREWHLIDAQRHQRVGTVHVRNRRKTPALRCVAILTPVSTPPGVMVGEREFVLHWADTDYTTHSSIATPVDIGSERRRLDVVFSFTAHGQAPLSGAWVAIPLALSLPTSAGQAYLVPGEYRFRLSVNCANGKGASKEFVITSPSTWNALSMRPAR